MSLAKEWLTLDAERECARIEEFLRAGLRRRFRKQGAVVALSGGVDSSVVGALCVRALGADRVLGLMLPERDSSAETLALSSEIASRLGVETVQVDITPLLEALGCYTERDAAIREVLPEFDASFQFKITLPSLLDQYRFRLFSVVARSPDGREWKARLTPESYLRLVAATNFKQRVRKMLEYHHADRRNYAVIGTPNRLEYDQGFFVKNGDGAADLKPIAHLYKTQVYQLASFLDIPESIRFRPPTTDTYSLAQTQEEFFFALPYDRMDICLCGKNEGRSVEEVAEAAGLTVEQVENVYRDIEAKRQAADYLQSPPLTLDLPEAPEPA